MQIPSNNNSWEQMFLSEFEMMLSPLSSRSAYLISTVLLRTAEKECKAWLKSVEDVPGQDELQVISSTDVPTICSTCTMVTHTGR